MMNTEPEHWKDRPLAKLTYDIKEEIDGLYPNRVGEVSGIYIVDADIDLCK